MRMKDNNRAFAEGGEFTRDLTTLRSKSRKKRDLVVTPAEQLPRREDRMDWIDEEEGSDNEARVRRTAKKGKIVLRKDRVGLSQLEEDLVVGFIEPAVLRPFKEVKTNIFGTAPPSWKLNHSQKGLSQEWMGGTME